MSRELVAELARSLFWIANRTCHRVWILTARERPISEHPNFLFLQPLFDDPITPRTFFLRLKIQLSNLPGKRNWNSLSECYLYRSNREAHTLRLFHFCFENGQTYRNFGRTWKCKVAALDETTDPITLGRNRTCVLRPKNSTLSNRAALTSEYSNPMAHSMGIQKHWMCQFWALICGPEGAILFSEGSGARITSQIWTLKIRRPPCEQRLGRRIGTFTVPDCQSNVPSGLNSHWQQKTEIGTSKFLDPETTVRRSHHSQNSTFATKKFNFVKSSFLD